MSPFLPRTLFPALLCGVLTVLVIQAPDSQTGYFALKVFVLWILAAGLHTLGWALPARFTLGMAITALLAPGFLAQNRSFARLSLFNWSLAALALLVLLLGVDWNRNRVLKSTSLILLFLAVPTLLLLQLGPLLVEVYSMPALGLARDFLPIPLAFAAFLLGFNLRPSLSFLGAVGLPLALSAAWTMFQ